MSVFKSFKLALFSIVTNKMRSFLTMLGIIIGVAAVIILVSIVDGMTGEMTNQFESFGTTALNVSVTDRSGQKKVEVEQMYKFIEENPEYFEGVSPSVTVGGSVRNGNDSITTSATGVSEEFASIKKLNVTDGRFLGFGEVNFESYVCVIGTYIKNEVFGNEDAVGKTIKLNGHSFTVVGVLEEKAESKQTSSDNCIYIPYTTAQKISQTKVISSYVAGAKSEEIVSDASKKLESFLEECLGDSDYYTVSNMKEILDTVNDVVSKMKMMLVAIAGISLLVGGIGIMNIMLVSVTERTREIGIRKSLGAKKRDIMSQFVIEAGTVSGIGGLLGIVVGGVASYAFGNMLGITAIPGAGAVAMSAGISVFIGILFGFLPANKAAKLNPIDALRYD